MNLQPAARAPIAMAWLPFIIIRCGARDARWSFHGKSDPYCSWASLYATSATLRLFLTVSEPLRLKLDSTTSAIHSKGKLGQAGHRADGGRVHHDLVAALLLGDLGERHREVADAAIGQRRRSDFDGGVVQDAAALGQIVPVQVDGLLVEGEQQVEGIVEGVERRTR